MASLTIGQIITEGALLAGSEPNTIIARARNDLKAWLRSQYDGYLWPMCKREAGAIPLAAGATTIQVGKGSSGISEEVTRVNDPLKLYTADGTTYQNVRVSTDWDFLHPDITNAQQGIPTGVRVRQPVTPQDGKWELVFDKVADRAYLVAMSYFIRPAAPAKDDDIPLYPNDRTLVQAVNAFCLRYSKSDDAMDQMRVTQAMVLEDRLKYGAMHGINETIGLDTRVFR